MKTKPRPVCYRHGNGHKGTAVKHFKLLIILYLANVYMCIVWKMTLNKGLAAFKKHKIMQRCNQTSYLCTIFLQKTSSEMHSVRLACMFPISSPCNVFTPPKHMLIVELVAPMVRAKDSVISIFN